MPVIEEFAAAKINLTLEVLGRRPDGYHALASLVAFALDAGDTLMLDPGPGLSLRTHGPEARAIDGPNLINAIAERTAADRPGLIIGDFDLEKRLPVASGIGGGSADAAAAIRAIARANNITDPQTAFTRIAISIGADIPVCIGGAGCTAAFMSGIGEKIWRPEQASILPPAGLAAMLVNPRVPVQTGHVFEALAAPLLTAEPVAKAPSPFTNSESCLGYIAASRNDLEAPAIEMVPIIANVLDALRTLPDCRLARMSGSGATCFALFDGIDAAKLAASRLREHQPGWWIRATRLA